MENDYLVNIYKIYCETLYAQQYSANVGVYYDIVDLTVRSTKKL